MVSKTQIHLLSLVALAVLTTSVSAGGKKDYQQECSMLSQVSNIFTKEDNDDPNACNTDKGLFCTGNKCDCVAGRAYEQGVLFGIFGGGKCVGAANRPCLSSEESTRCVSNAECTSAICICKEGFKATTEGHCSNSGQRFSAAGMTPVYILALIASSYFALSEY